MIVVDSQKARTTTSASFAAVQWNSLIARPVKTATIQTA